LFQFLMVATLLCLAAVLRSGTENYASNALLTLGGVLYLGLLGSAPLLIVHQAGPEHGGDVGYLLAVIFLGIWLADSAAYLCGRRWGRIKLVPAISPCKTVVGLVAGLLGGLLPLSLYGFIAVLKPVELLGLLLLTGAGAQVGDLVESAIKRDLGVKDAPALIPGHGGALDRFDSYFFAFPLAYVYIELIGGF
jgi:phosphatidate cytidylyltransferase